MTEGALRAGRPPLTSLERRTDATPVPVQDLISAAMFGVGLLVAGLVGWDLRYSHGWFAGAHWIDPPVWWELAAGTALLLVATFLARRIARASSGDSHPRQAAPVWPNRR